MAKPEWPDPGSPSSDRIRSALECGAPVVFSPNEPREARHVLAMWIQDAVRNGRPVDISNAVVLGALQLGDGTVHEAFALRDCECEALDISYSTFQKTCCLSGSSIAEFQAIGTTFVRDVNLERAHVLGPANLSSVTLTGDLVAESATFDAGLSIVKATLQKGVRFVNATFSGAVQVTVIRVEDSLDFSGATFSQLAHIYGATVGGAIIFRGARLNGGILCVESSCQARFVLQHAHVSGGLTFDRVTIGGNLSAREVVFASRVSVLATTVEGQAIFHGARFAEFARFHLFRVGSQCLFSAERGVETSRPATFEGDLDFWGTAVADDLILRGARFNAQANFEQIRVGRDLLAEGASFAGRTLFIGAEVGGSAYFSGTTFGGRARFARLSVRGSLFFQSVRGDDGTISTPAATFQSLANFFMIRVANSAFFRDVQFHSEANFERSKIAGSATFWYARFDGDARFLQADLGDLVVFEGCTFARNLDLRLSRTGTLVMDAQDPTASQGYGDELHILTWKPERGKVPSTTLKTVDLRSMQYDSISAYIGPLLQSSAQFDRRTYRYLENVLRRTGEDALANTVYHARRSAESKRLPMFSPAHLGDQFVRLTTGYGVGTWNIACSAAIVLAFGTAGFELPGTARPKPPEVETLVARAAQQMRTPTAKIDVPKTQAEYCAHPERPPLDTAFWLAVKTASPIELPPETRWEPVACPIPHTPLTNYYFAGFLRLLGVLFLGLTAASLSGLLRYVGSRDP
ncbi:MAG TPA: pentapeptide repeat-containing protein [Candidatus Elarobacter sp.]|jgi:hypothetical protein